jgi:excisionase family DNA binding protein
LSIDEAAAYFRIGRDKLYQIVSENKDADFILWNGTRAQIKRKKFENYIDKLNIL